MRIINFIKKHQYLLGVFAIVTCFILVRLPYFLYMPIPFINGDAFEYNRVVNLLETGSNTQIGFPGIGYPLLILFCEKINDTTIFFFFIQSVLQLFAVLLFYHYYKVYLKKYLLYVAILLIGYLTSNINIYYDTAYHPDSLIGSLFIISLALFLKIIFKPSYIYFTLLSTIIIFSISVRANGLVLIPILLIYLVYHFIIYKRFVLIIKYLGLFFIPTLALCLFHYLSPIYKTFNIVSYPSSTNLESFSSGAESETNEGQVWNKIQKLNLDKYLYTNFLKNKSFFYRDTSFAVYLMAQQRGYIVKNDSNENIILENYNDSRSIWASINLDSIVYKNSSKQKEFYKKFKSRFLKKYKDKKLLISTPIDFKHKAIHFIGFNQLFYESIDLRDVVLGFENLGYYDENSKMRYGNCFNEIRDTNNLQNKKRVFKELMNLKNLSNNQLYKKIDEDLWRMKVSKYYRYIISPFYKIQPILFRNFLYPLLFNLVFIFSIVGVFYSRFRSKIFIFTFTSSLLLIGTNLLFSFYFCYSYTRYTYQVTFVYYVSVIVLPILFQEIKKGNKINISD